MLTLHPEKVDWSMIKKDNKKNNIEDVVANSCLGKRPVGSCGDIKNINIESLIHIVRGQKVMLDSDLAMLYGVLMSQIAISKPKDRRGGTQ